MLFCWIYNVFVFLRLFFSWSVFSFFHHIFTVVVDANRLQLCTLNIEMSKGSQINEVIISATSLGLQRGKKVPIKSGDHRRIHSKKARPS